MTYSIFLEDVDNASYADDTTTYKVNEKKESVISELETSSSLLFGWFNNDIMKANSGKSHLVRAVLFYFKLYSKLRMIISNNCNACA